MKNISFSFLLFLCLGIMLTSCKKDEAEPEAIVINADNFSAALPGNTQNGTVVGTVSATTNGGTLTYTWASQGIAGALTINATTGQITVASASDIYRFYCNTNPRPTSFTSTITISNGSTTKTITLTVNLSSLLCTA